MVQRGYNRNFGSVVHRNVRERRFRSKIRFPRGTPYVAGPAIGQVDPAVAHLVFDEIIMAGRQPELGLDPGLGVRLLDDLGGERFSGQGDLLRADLFKVDLWISSSRASRISQLISMA